VKQSFIPLLMLRFAFHVCISRESLFVLVYMLRPGRQRNFVSIATEAKIYFRCQEPTPTQAQIASYSMEIGSFLPGDKVAGA
jgi:hypothetical protein